MLFENLPLDIVSSQVLGFLSIRDIVMLERSCGSRKSHKLFLNLIPYSLPVILPFSKQKNISLLKWFAKRRCKIETLSLFIPGDYPCLHVKNILVGKFELLLDSNITMEENCKRLLENNICVNLNLLVIIGNQNMDVIQQLSAYTKNLKKLLICRSDNCIDWLTFDILTRWKLKTISLSGFTLTTNFVLLLVQTCTELTSIRLDSSTVDDAVVMAVAQHCPKLETLILSSNCTITDNSLLALSERGLPLEKLDINPIPNIPTADIARRCSHALSCIRDLRTNNMHNIDAHLYLPYMTGLTTLSIYEYFHSFIPLLTQHCHKLTCLSTPTYTLYPI